MYTLPEASNCTVGILLLHPAISFSLIMDNNGCPNCFDLKRKTKRQKHPPIMESQHAMNHWDWAANQAAGLDPHKLTSGSSRHAHGICYACPIGQPHAWKAIMSNVCKGSGCPCCQGRKACACNTLQSLHLKLLLSGTTAERAIHSNHCTLKLLLSVTAAERDYTT